MSESLGRENYQNQDDIQHSAERGQNWTESSLGRVIAGTIAGIELSPANEVLRLAAVGFALKNGDPMLAALVAGTTTMIIEGGGAIVAADAVDTKTGKTLVDKTNARINKLKLSSLLQTNTATEAGVAMIAGSAVVTVLKHSQDPARTRSDNRRYGLKASAGISLISTIQAWTIGEGISSPSPVTIGLAALAVGATVGGLRWAGNRVKHEAPLDVELAQTHDSAPYVERTTKEAIDDKGTIKRSSQEYLKIVSSDQDPQKLGLSEEEVEKALLDDTVIKTVHRNEHGEEIYLPFLVPLKNLYWYNKDYLAKHFDSDNLFYFAHASGEFDDNDPRGLAISEITQNGGAIIYDVSQRPGKGIKGDLRSCFNSYQPYDYEKLGSSDHSSFLNQYESKITFKNAEDAEFNTVLSPFEQYIKAVEEGEFKFDPLNGPAFVDIIDGEEADKMWAVYDAPFKRIALKNPIGASYDEESFKGLLADPTVTKCINRQDGETTALSIYVNELDQCPWLNKAYYEKNYPEAITTNNLFISLGIVADQNIRTAGRSAAIQSLAIKTLALRGTPAVFAFECNDVSYKYIPKLVAFTVRRSRVGRFVDDITEPKSQLTFHALRAKNN